MGQRIRPLLFALLLVLVMLGSLGAWNKIRDTSNGREVKTEPERNVPYDGPDYGEIAEMLDPRRAWLKTVCPGLPAPEPREHIEKRRKEALKALLMTVFIRCLLCAMLIGAGALDLVKNIWIIVKNIRWLMYVACVTEYIDIHQVDVYSRRKRCWVMESRTWLFCRRRRGMPQL